MNKAHPPRFPRRNKGSGHGLLEVAGKIATLAVFFTAAWLWLVIAGGQ